MIKKVNVLGTSQEDYINMAVIEAEDKDGWELRAVTGDIDLSIRLGVPLWGIFYKHGEAAVKAPVVVKTVEEAVKVVDAGKVDVKPQKRVKSKIKKDWK